MCAAGRRARGTATRVVLASANRGKQREFAALLQPLGYTLLLQSELGIVSPPETGATFIANALLKARHAAAAARLPAIADDSGLEVDALGGRPGIHSARYASPGADHNSSDADNLALLLHELRDVPEPGRAARYQCALAWVDTADDPAPLTAQAAWEGSIASTPRGANGFGYDPVFLPRGDTRTAAEFSAQEKDRVSHRALALQSLLTQLAAR